MLKNRSFAPFHLSSNGGTGGAPAPYPPPPPSISDPLRISFGQNQVPTPYAGSAATYSYDALSRLTGESYPGQTNTWSYDWMGNRLDSGWAYNEVDELNAGSGYAYDMKGALEYDPSAAGDARLHFQYGSDDLLRQIDREGSTPLNQTSMTWDADEQRLQLTEQVSYDRWQFLYDAAVGIPAVLVQRTADQDNTTLGVTVYVREPGGELLASFEPGAGATYYHFDALGSTVLLSDSSGNPDGAYAYGAWGDVLAAPGTWQPYQYVGQLGYYTHTTSQGAEVADWLQLGVRFYQPELGRFERRDPLRSTGESAYRYANDNPAVFRDAWGLAATASNPGAIGYGNGQDWTAVFEKCEECYSCYKSAKKRADETLGKYEEWRERAGIPDPKARGIEWGDFGGNGWHNAVAHCNASCEIGRSCTGCSRTIMQGRELFGWPMECEMDRLNNRQGFDCADNSSNGCLRCCLNKLEQGKLAAIRPRW